MWTAQARRRYAWTRRKEGLRLTDREWALIKPLLPEQGGMGRPWKHELRRVLDAILYLLRTGCGWSALPEWAPPRSTVYDWFRRLADEGWLERLHHTLMMAMREHQGRSASPTLGIVDSQTVRVMAPDGPRGYDAAKKVNGRKRHILVDICGNLLAVRVTDGAMQDRDGGIALTRRVRTLFPWLVTVVADSGYTGRFETALASLHMAVQIVRRGDFAKGFMLLPRRWRVEQAFGAGRFCRRLIVDHETLPHVSEAMIRLSSIMRFVRALTA